MVIVWYGIVAIYFERHVKPWGRTALNLDKNFLYFYHVGSK